MSDEEERKARILVNMNWYALVARLNESTSKLVFLMAQKFSEEELALPFDGVLYLPPADLWDFSTTKIEEEVERFEQFIHSVDGIEGKSLAIWVDSDDWAMKDTLVEKLRLEEKNCEWCWDYVRRDEKDNAIHLRLCKFFEENTQQCQIKPAKR